MGQRNSTSFRLDGFSFYAPPLMTYAEKVELRKKQKRADIFHKTNGMCAYCGCELKLEGYYSFQIDHIIPKRRYKHRLLTADAQIGTDELNNLHACCESCNACKSDSSLEEFRERVADRVWRLNNYSSEYRIAKRFGLVKEIKKEIVFYFETLTPKPDAERHLLLLP